MIAIDGPAWGDPSTSHSGKYGRGLSTNNTVYHQLRRYYTIYNRAGRYYQRRIRWTDGREKNIVEKEIHYVWDREIIPAPICTRRRRAITAIADRLVFRTGGFWAMTGI